jgi:hypothetical protein
VSAPAADTDSLSAECVVGREPGYEDMHDRCRQAKDIPVHPRSPRILLVARCRCSCHGR